MCLVGVTKTLSASWSKEKHKLHKVRKGRGELGCTRQNNGKYVRLQLYTGTQNNDLSLSKAHKKDAFVSITKKGGCSVFEEKGGHKISEGRH